MGKRIVATKFMLKLKSCATFVHCSWALLKPQYFYKKSKKLNLVFSDRKLLQRVRRHMRNVTPAGRRGLGKTCLHKCTGYGNFCPESQKDFNKTMGLKRAFESYCHII